ncbi:IclR family transcriptional regulator [Amycolatopsis acidicola]|uniref:Glycerol operon regulatory protein n=1 Tax=Amycolatopsis acidicola TaxID=2596893 RepID=A0A5N0UT28_9PSEU|nr:IclR family transcriptional regulator [Amycolatopsis acidicola]KAA9155266.1 IclR family transcriptional regulator [Amycolatopsis acidicola]
MTTAGSRIAVIGKAAQVLDALLASPRGATPTELAASLDLNRSTAFRLLVSLEHAGLVDQDPATSRYRLGLRLLVLGDAVRDRLDIVRVAEPVVRELRDEVRQTVYLALRDGWGAVCVHRLPGPDVDVLAWRTGQWLPFHQGAGPRALLAALPDEELETYLALDEERPTRHGALTTADIRALVRETRERGWSLNPEDLTDGVSSLGFAVRRSVCAISVAGLSQAYQGKRLDDLASAVERAATRLGALLAGH